MPWRAVVLIEGKSGERHLAGDWINASLFNEAGGVFALWGLIAAAAVEAGAALESLAEIGEMARHVAGSLETPEYGKLRAPAGHAPSASAQRPAVEALAASL